VFPPKPSHLDETQMNYSTRATKTELTFRLSTGFFVFWTLVVPTVSPLAADDGASKSSTTSEHDFFFENRVRPLLEKHCLECHSADQNEGDVLLDSPSAILKSVADGPIVKPGDVKASRLMSVVEYDQDVQMPPESKLAPAEILVFKKWIEIGAPWPKSNVRIAREVKGAIDFEAEREGHWAFSAIERPSIPKVVREDLVTNEVDSFVEKQLEAMESNLTAAADRYTLIRRATIDLLGVPPTVEEVERFVADRSPEAYAKLLDRLLASPMYGERWGRYWLDVARYADTKGYVFQEEPRYPYSYTYRDYVIRSFNEDKPYDQFIKEQLAADQLGLPAGDVNLAGLGFLTVGHRFLNKRPEIVDDRIDVVTRGLMGMTMACARCHNHKLEPIEMTDYYALYGVFINSVEPQELPLIGDPADSPFYDEFKKELSAREAKRDQFVQEQEQAVLAELRVRLGEYLVAVVKKNDSLTTEPNPDAKKRVLKANEPKTAKAKSKDETKKQPLRPLVVDLWQTYIKRLSEKPNPVFSPWVEFEAFPREEAGFATRLEEWLQQQEQRSELAESQVSPDDDGEPSRDDAGEPSRDDAGEPSRDDGKVNSLVVETIRKHRPKSMEAVAEAYASLLLDIDRQRQELAKNSAAPPRGPIRFNETEKDDLLFVLYSPNAPFKLAEQYASKLFGRDVRDKLTRFENEIKKWALEGKGSPPRAMVLEDATRLVEQKVFLRGDASRPGDSVQRRFPQILSNVDDQVFQRGSGRLDLAEAITDPKNPLTPRVWANRIWMHHFGNGLVRTAGDFGVNGQEPSHPELLDFLARELLDNRWSTKRIHRLIMLSSTYKQSSQDRPELRVVDPDNRMLWRMNRRRLDFESMRDSMLFVSKRFDSTMGGNPIDIYSQPESRRRSVYGMINRNDVHSQLLTFDFPDPSTSSPQRTETTVPQQALFGMNSAFVVQQVEQLSKLIHDELKSETAKPDNGLESNKDFVEWKVNQLYRQVFSRNAVPDELELAAKFVGNAEGDAGQSRWRQLAHALLLTNEFMFVD